MSIYIPLHIWVLWLLVACFSGAVLIGIGFLLGWAIRAICKPDRKVVRMFGRLKARDEKLKALEATIIERDDTIRRQSTRITRLEKPLLTTGGNP
jgi:ABC-type transport system involved in cytochrome c biogenesis permease subunit